MKVPGGLKMVVMKASRTDQKGPDEGLGQAHKSRDDGFDQGSKRPR